MKKPLVTIIIPVYNVEKYIAECLNSVIRQTYSNIEVIIINDGSNDNSYEIIESYSKKYNNLKIIDQENKGQSVARNVGLTKAKGKYIYFLDSDDYIKDITIENLVSKMEENKLDLIRFSAEVIYDKNIKYKPSNYNLEKYFKKDTLYTKDEFLKINKRAFIASPVLFMVKRDILTRNQIIFYPGIIHEDELFTLEVFLNVNRIMYDPYPYYMRRYRQGSTMTSIGSENVYYSFNSRGVIVSELKKMLKKYHNKRELKLIKRRLRSNNDTMLLNNYIDKVHKRRIITKANNYGVFRYNIKRFLLTIRLLFIKFLRNKIFYNYR